MLQLMCKAAPKSLPLRLFSCSSRLIAAEKLQGEKSPSDFNGRDAGIGETEVEVESKDYEDADDVHVEYRGKKMRVKKGSILRSSLLQNSVSPHNGRAAYINCRSGLRNDLAFSLLPLRSSANNTGDGRGDRGLGTCGTCAVQVLGRVAPEEWGPMETLRLKLPPHNPSRNAPLRLACQVRVEEDLTVIKYDKFWGQGDVALGSLSEDELNMFKLPLGDLEYIADRAKNAVDFPPRLKRE